MKIAFLSSMSAYPWGGSEELWSQTAAHLARGGHRVAALIQHWPQSRSPVENLRQAGVRVTEFRGTPRDFWSQAAARVARRLSLPGAHSFLRDWLRDASPQLACISQGGAFDGMSQAEACLAAEIPYVMLSQANAERDWPDDAKALRALDVYRRAQLACFVSQANLSLLEDQLGIDLPRARVVRNPVNVDWRAPLDWPDASGGYRWACVGRLSPADKGQDLLLRVLASPEWRARDVTLSCFGSGPMEAGLRRLRHRLGLDEVIHFEGHVGDVREIWRTHHALVLPSRREGLPLSICEAMLCGRPVIATDISGNSEVVDDSQTGFLASAPSVSSLRQALERAWESRGRWEEMGRTARARMADRYARDPVEDFAGLLTTAIAPHPDAVEPGPSRSEL